MMQGRMNDFYKQYEELVIKFETQEKLLKENNDLVKSLNKTIDNLNKTIEELRKVNETQAKEILKLTYNQYYKNSKVKKNESIFLYKIYF